jgi:cytoskeletal protein CcmA (bactofilin family)
MKKKFRVFLSILLVLIVGCGAVVAFAVEEKALVKGGESYSGDLIAAGDSAINDGHVLGDILVFTQSLQSRGRVDGDIWGFSYDAQVDGEIDGNVRLAAYDAKLSATVARNVMIIATSITINQDAVIHRNLSLMGNKVMVMGKVEGRTDIHSLDITLGGLYEGDVFIHDMTEDSKINILPGTVIKGKLTYEGVLAYQVPQDVEVGDYEYVKINPVSKTPQTGYSIRSIIKQLVTVVFYYLIALLLYKLFPRFFGRSGEFIAGKPLTAAGIGIATLGSIIGGGLLLILLFILTILILKIKVFVYTGLAYVFFAALTIAFADIPVSLWLGNLMARKNTTIPNRLAIGLITITAVKIALDLLGYVPALSVFAGIIAFLVNAFIWVMGTGALLRVIFEIFKSANAQAEAEADEIEPVDF